MSRTAHFPPAGPARAQLLGRLVMTAAALFSAAAGLAAQTLVLPIQALDPEGVAVPGVRFTYGGAETPDTTDAGVTELRVPLRADEDVPPGTAVELGLPASLGRTWFLIDDTVHVPATGEPPAEVVLMTRAAFRRLAAEVRDAPAGGADELSEARRRQAVAEYAAGYGLDEMELERAIAAFRESADDPMDEGVAAFLSREWARAEPLFRQALAEAEERLEEAEEDIAESARYLGSTLYEQGRYREAVAAFRKALAAREDDPVLQGWLGSALHKNAEWAESELWMRRALSIDEATYGPDHAEVATDLNNLALLLEDTNRLAEAEPLMRRALAIAEASYGPDHPDVAIGLNNLAQLLQDTNRLAEAEPLMRRALAICEASLGDEHPHTRIARANLAALLSAIAAQPEPGSED